MAILWEEWLSSMRIGRLAIMPCGCPNLTHEVIGARRWMTFKQLCDKYQDQDVAESIRTAKLSNPEMKDHVKPHPDNPDNPATHLHTAQALQVQNASGSTGRSICNPQMIGGDNCDMHNP